MGYAKIYNKDVADGILRKKWKVEKRKEWFDGEYANRIKERIAAMIIWLQKKIWRSAENQKEK